MATLITVGSILAIAALTSVFVELTQVMTHDLMCRVGVPERHYGCHPGGARYQADRFRDLPVDTN